MKVAYRILWIVALAIFFPAFGCNGGLTSTTPPVTTTPQPANVSVVVNTGTEIVPSFTGFGVEWDPYSYPPMNADWTTTLSRLSYMRPSFFRIMSSATDYCLGFDQNGTPIYVWQQGDSVVQQHLWQVFRMLDYAQANNIDVILGEWAWPSGLATPGANPISGPDDPRWARIVSDYVNYLVNTKGYTVIKYYNLMNEPDGSWMWPNNSVPSNAFSLWSTGIQNLRADLNNLQLKNVSVIGPDNACFGSLQSDGGDWNWLNQAAQNLASDIGVWDSHWYAWAADTQSDLIEQTLSAEATMLSATDPHAAGKPRLLGEAGMLDGKNSNDQNPNVQTFIYGVWMADLGTQVARGGWTGASAWDLDDAMHSSGDSLKLWGFWNTFSAPGDPAQGIRPWFYTWSLMSRLLPQGAAIVSTSGGESQTGFRSVAATRTSNSQTYTTIMLVNDADAALAVTVSAPSLGAGDLTEYHYFATDSPADSNGFPIPEETLTNVDLISGIAVNMPSRGVVFLLFQP
jgi:hypothetical protein